MCVFCVCRLHMSTSQRRRGKMFVLFATIVFRYGEI